MPDLPNPHFVYLKDGEEVELLFEEPAALELEAFSDVLIGFVSLQVDETYEQPVLYEGKNENRAKRILQCIVQKMSNASSGILSSVYRKLMKRVYPNGWFFGWSKQDEFNWAWNDSSQLLKQKRFALAKINGEIVSVAAFKLGGELEDKRKVYELTKFVTLPGYRGRGVYSLLRDEFIRRIQKRFPDSPLMTFTKNKTVIHRCQETGWRPVPLEAYSEITKRIGRSGLSSEDRAALKHWKSFILDPVHTNQNLENKHSI